MSKASERQEITTYVIKGVPGKIKDNYRISKRVMGVETDFYFTIVQPKGDKLVPVKLWCSCPGFHIQKFPKIEHKHIRMVFHYQALGEPVSAEYRMSGTGQNTIITHKGVTV